MKKAKLIILGILILTIMTLFFAAAKAGILGRVVIRDTGMGWGYSSDTEAWGVGIWAPGLYMPGSGECVGHGECRIVIGKYEVMSPFSFVVTRFLFLASIVGGIALIVAIIVVLRRQKVRLRLAKFGNKQRIEQEHSQSLAGS